MRTLSLTLLVIICLSWGVVANSAEESNAAEAAVREAVQAYVDAYNARDASALAALWSPQGVYISRSTGEQITGREALTKEFSGIFAGDNVPTLSVATESVQFVSPSVAVEHGTAVVDGGESEPNETRYNAVYINHDGSWLLDRVTEEDVEQVVSNYEQLKGLEFLIGEWVDSDDEVTIRSNCQWTQNQNYISRRYSVESDQQVTSTGLQIIGWDAKSETIRSWLFDSSGTTIEGTWSERNGNWMARSVATLHDGSSGSFTSVFRPIDEDTYGWRKVNRVVDGNLLPNVAEVLVNRQ